MAIGEPIPQTIGETEEEHTLRGIELLDILERRLQAIEYLLLTLKTTSEDHETRIYDLENP